MTRISPRQYSMARDWAIGTTATASIFWVATKVFAKYYTVPWPVRLAFSAAVGTGLAITRDNGVDHPVHWTHGRLRKAGTEDIREIARTAPLDEVLSTPRLWFNSYQWNGEKIFAFLDGMALHKDTSSQDVWERLVDSFGKTYHVHGLPSFEEDMQRPAVHGKLSEQALGKLLQLPNLSCDHARLLLNITRNHPDRQKQILEVRPLKSDTIARFWPVLHEETIRYLLENNPSVWDLVICLRAGGDARHLLAEKTVEELFALVNQWPEHIAPDDYFFRALFKSLDNDKALGLLQRHFEKKEHFLPNVWKDLLCREDLNDEALLKSLNFFGRHNNSATARVAVYWRPQLYSRLPKWMQVDVATRIAPKILGKVLTLGGKLSPRTPLQTVLKAYAYTGEKKPLRERLIEEVKATPIGEMDVKLSEDVLSDLIGAKGADFFNVCRRRDLFYILSKGMKSGYAIKVLKEARARDFPYGKPKPQVSLPVFLWMCQCEKDDVRDVIGFALRENALPDYQDNIHKANELSDEARVCWHLACALTSNEREPFLPKSLADALKAKPAYYGKAIGSWGRIRPAILRLPSVLYGCLELRDHQEFTKLLLALVPAAGDNAFHILKDSGCLVWGSARQIVLSGWTGDNVIERLKQKLLQDHGNYQTTVEAPTSTAEQNTLSGLTKDMLYYLCDFLDPYDVGILAGMCKILLIRLGGEQGEAVWQKKGLGSIGAVRDMYRLVVQLSDDKYTGKIRRLNTDVLKKAWPEQLLPTPIAYELWDAEKPSVD